MEGLAAARALTTRAPARPLRGRSRLAPTGVYDLTLAGADDDADVRRLLRGSAFPGDIQVSLEREPDARLAATIEGDVHQTIVARHRVSGELAAVASRSVRDAFLNGEPARLGYLGLLRIDPRFRRHRRLLDTGFDFCRQLHVSDGARRAGVHLASVVADNEPARRLLARSDPEWPRFEPVDTLVTIVIPVTSGTVRRVPGLEIRRGSVNISDEIVSCLQRNGRRAQFHPVWTQSDLLSPTRTRGLDPDDFVVAVRDDRIVGCAACWDQRAFKQVMVRGYSDRLARFRRVINLVAPFVGSPALPAAGSLLRFAYVSHLALDEGEDDRALIALVAAVCEMAGARALDYVLVGASARSSWRSTLGRSFRHREYESVLYLSFWPEEEPLAASLDGRPSYPELAIL